MMTDNVVFAFAEEGVLFLFEICIVSAEHDCAMMLSWSTHFQRRARIWTSGTTDRPCNVT